MSDFMLPDQDEQFAQPLSEVITDYQLGERLQKDKWGAAVTIAFNSGATNREEWRDYFGYAEEEQGSARERRGEIIARTIAGKIVATKAFPKTWNTDKHIIGKAIDAGVPLLDSAGNPIPKDKIQDSYKAVVAPKSDKTPYEKIITVINAYQALYGELSNDDQDSVRDMMDVIHA